MLSWQQRRWLVSGEGGRTKYVLLSSDSYGAQAAKGSEDYRPPSLLHAPELTPPYPADSPGEQEAVLRNHIHAYFNSNVDIPEVRQGPWTHAGRVGQGSQVLLPSQVPASADLPVKAAAERAVAAEVAAFLHGNKDTILRRVIGGALP